MDIPLDGSVSYFALADNSMIVTKQLQQDGTSKTIIYKPTEDSGIEIPKYVTSDELNKAIENIDTTSWKEEAKAFKKQLKDITREIEDMKEGK